MSRKEIDGPESCEELLDILRLGNSVAEAFLVNPGDSVFRKVPAVVSEAVRTGMVVFAWADSWGIYAGATSGSEAALRWDADAWQRLPVGGDWSADVVPIGSPEFVGLGEITAIPLKDHGAAIGFIGICGAEEKELERCVRLLKGVSPSLRVFTQTRVSELRREAMQRMTSDAFAKSEKRLKDFIEESKDTIYIADGSGSVVLINKAAEELLGVPRTEIIGNSLSKYCPFSLDREYFMEQLGSEGFVRDFELTLQRLDGSILFVTESATAVRGPDGAVAEIHGIIRDITERLESQRDLWRANLELADINEQLKRTQLAMVQQEKLASIGQLAAGIAHEINNPLGFLMSNIGSLRTLAFSLSGIVETARSADVPVIVDAIEKAKIDFLLSDMPAIFSEMDEGFKRIAEIVKDLRSFARSGEADKRTNYDLNEGVRQTLVIARNETRYVADVETSFGEVPPVLASAGEVNQVVLNILVNAAQAIASQQRAEHGKIAVSTSADDKDVVLEIADDGPGIPEDTAKRIFEPFYTTKEPGKGTGLGLSISWDIITRKHGGTLTFRNREGGGTVFRIALPLNPPLRTDT